MRLSAVPWKSVASQGKTLTGFACEADLREPHTQHANAYMRVDAHLALYFKPVSQSRRNSCAAAQAGLNPHSSENLVSS